MNSHFLGGLISITVIAAVTIIAMCVAAEFEATSYKSTIHRQAECIRALSGMDEEARATFCDEEVE